MSAARDGGEARRARAHDANEETRYVAVNGLEPTDAGDRAALLEALGDPSWRVRAAAAERLGAAPGESLPRLVEMLTAGRDVGMRDAAASALARAGPVALPALLDQLSSADSDARQAAIAVLGAIGDRRSVAPLSARLADPDPNVRTGAAEALGKIGGPVAVAALVAAVDSDDATLRLSAVEALAAQRVCLPAARISELLEDGTARRAVYRLLGACDDVDALGFIARGVSEPSRSARESALAALGRQRARRTLEALSRVAEEARAAASRVPGLPDAWAASLRSDEPFVAVGALTALAMAGAPRHVVPMLQLADEDRYRMLVEEAVEAMPPGAELRAALADALPGLGQLARVTALAALAANGSPAALESIVRVASDPEAYAQGEAIAALGRLRDARGVSPLTALLGDDDGPFVAGTAAYALVRIAQGGDDARAAVLEALRDRAGASASAALYRVLGTVGDETDVAVLRNGLRSESVVRRGAAAAALGAILQRGLGGSPAVRELLGALRDPAWTVRAAAARAFAEAAASGGREALCADGAPALAAALDDPEAAVRAAAAEALGACGRRECAGRIRALADDQAAPAALVVAALRALAALGGAPAELVVRAAAHADPEVVKEAVLAAALLRGQDGERLVRDAAASPRWDVRRAAASAMAARGDPALGPQAARLAATEPDPLVARAFADAARALGA